VFCADPNLADMCFRDYECMTCIYFYLEEHFPDDECKID
ncbi:hypothetical protein AVEN_204623-1, partial [Araneus ventricosus]